LRAVASNWFTIQDARYPRARPTTSKLLSCALLVVGWLSALGALGQPAFTVVPLGVHLKPTPGNETLIRQQLAAGNVFGVQLVFPEQGRCNFSCP
jgi:hypothetical protein